MKKRIVIIAALAFLANASFAQKKTTTTTKKTTTANLKKTADGFTILPSGLEYKFIKDVPGGMTAGIEDQIQMHFKSSVKDSVLFNTHTMQPEAVLFPLQKPSFNGDVNEGLALMSAGDVAIFRTPLDSIAKAGQMLLPWMKNSDKMVYEVEVLTVKTKDQVKKEFEEKSASQIGVDEKILQDYFKANNLKPLKTASGLYYLITTPGKGENAKAGQEVTVNYTGKTTNGEKFDSNVDPEFQHVQPFSFGLGKGNVIKGWDEGMALMNKGAKAILFIPSRYAYGPQSPSPKIPANSVLIFDVEITDITGDAGVAPVQQDGHGHDHDSHDGHKH